MKILYIQKNEHQENEIQPIHIFTLEHGITVDHAFGTDLDDQTFANFAKIYEGQPTSLKQIPLKIGQHIY